MRNRLFVKDEKQVICDSEIIEEDSYCFYMN